MAQGKGGYSWLPGQEGGRVQSPQGVPQPNMLDYTLLPLMAAMMEKKKSETADMRSIFPTMIAAGMAQPGGDTGTPFGGQNWKINTSPFGNLDQLNKLYTLKGKQQELAGIPNPWEIDKEARLLANAGLNQNYAFQEKLMSKDAKDREEALEMQNQTINFWKKKIQSEYETTPVPEPVSSLKKKIKTYTAMSEQELYDAAVAGDTAARQEAVNRGFISA